MPLIRTCNLYYFLLYSDADKCFALSFQIQSIQVHEIRSYDPTWGGGVKAYCQSVGLIQAGQLADRQIMIGSGAQTIIKTPLSGRIAEAIRI